MGLQETSDLWSDHPPGEHHMWRVTPYVVPADGVGRHTCR
jgi:hypothetical protein